MTRLRYRYARGIQHLKREQRLCTNLAEARLYQRVIESMERAIAGNRPVERIAWHYMIAICNGPPFPIDLKHRSGECIDNP